MLLVSQGLEHRGIPYNAIEFLRFSTFSAAILLSFSLFESGKLWTNGLDSPDGSKLLDKFKVLTGGRGMHPQTYEDCQRIITGRRQAVRNVALAIFIGRIDMKLAPTGDDNLEPHGFTTKRLAQSFGSSTRDTRARPALPATVVFCGLLDLCSLDRLRYQLSS
jgi:hypothetical protein